jgi:hypothetical protein
LIRADIKILNPEETSLFSSLLSPALVSLLSTDGFAPEVDCKVSVPLPRSPPISPLSSMLLSVFGEWHGHVSHISLPRFTSILLLNSCCPVFFFTFARPDLVRKKLFASRSISEDLYVGVIVPFCCFSNVYMNKSVVEEVDNSRIWICLLHHCYVVVFYSNLFFTKVPFQLQHFLDPITHVTSISLINLCC